MGPEVQKGQVGSEAVRSTAKSLTRTPNHDRDRTKHEATPGDLAPARPNRAPTPLNQMRSREALNRGPRGRLGPPRTRLGKEQLRRAASDARPHMHVPLVQSRVTRRGIGDVRLS